MQLNELDRAVYRVTFAFLAGRFEDRATVDWALRLKLDDAAKRMAVLDLIDAPNGRKIRDPWRSAWRLIEESWDNPVVAEHSSTDAYDVGYRLNIGDRSGSIVSATPWKVAPGRRLDASPAPLGCQSRLSRRWRSDLMTCGHRLSSARVSTGSVPAAPPPVRRRADPARRGAQSVNTRAMATSLAFAFSSVSRPCGTALDSRWSGGRQVGRRPSPPQPLRRA